jgi:hypothetical protein
MKNESKRKKKAPRKRKRKLKKQKEEGNGEEVRRRQAISKNLSLTIIRGVALSRCRN